MTQQEYNDWYKKMIELQIEERRIKQNKKDYQNQIIQNLKERYAYPQRGTTRKNRNV